LFKPTTLRVYPKSTSFGALTLCQGGCRKRFFDQLFDITREEQLDDIDIGGVVLMCEMMDELYGRRAQE